MCAARPSERPLRYRTQFPEHASYLSFQLAPALRNPILKIVSHALAVGLQQPVEKLVGVRINKRVSPNSAEQQVNHIAHGRCRNSYVNKIVKLELRTGANPLRHAIPSEDTQVRRFQSCGPSPGTRLLNP